MKSWQRNGRPFAIAPMSADPFFSVFITAYNRAEHVERCVRSVLGQSFPDFEVVVVDDGSTDATPAVLESIADPRLRVIRHEFNRGFYPARATGVDCSRGEWLVMLDSDWELFPHSLARLRVLIDECPAGVRIIRSRLQCDDGSVQPGIMPSRTTGYRDRLRWMEAVTVDRAPSDAGHCIHRSVLERSNYFGDRRGDMSLLWETNLARTTSSLWLTEILGKKHSDASNSLERDVRASRVIPRLLQEAPDGLWMAETMLQEHGDELSIHAPSFHRSMMERAAMQAFLIGDRRAGLRHARAALRSGSSRVKLWATLGLGLLGPRALAYAKLAARRQPPAVRRAAPGEA
jgi:hypothetical protein